MADGVRIGAVLFASGLEKAMADGFQGVFHSEKGMDFLIGEDAFTVKVDDQVLFTTHDAHVLMDKVADWLSGPGSYILRR